MWRPYDVSPCSPSMLLLFPYLNVAVSEIYSHVYGLHGNVILSSKYLGCPFGAHVLDWRLERFFQRRYIVHFGNYLEVSVPESITEELLLGETRVQCIILP